jgi:sulfur carrier protein
MKAPEMRGKCDYSCARRAFLHGKIRSSMKLMINGEARQFPSPLTVAALVDVLGHSGKRIAVERNGEIVARGNHAEVTLADGDRIEIVVAVGGG